MALESKVPTLLARREGSGGVRGKSLPSYAASPERRWSCARLVRLLLCAILSLLFLGKLFGHFSHHAPTRPDRASSRAGVSKDQYIDAVLRSPVGGPIDLEPIRKKCSQAQYQRGLVWDCNTVGSAGTVGNAWLNCAQYAIDAGATMLILPRFDASGGSLDGLSAHPTELSDLFDVDYFLQTWDEVCPQILAVVSPDEDFTGMVPQPFSDRSRHLTSSDADLLLPAHNHLHAGTRSWRAAFDAWLEGAVPGTPLSAKEPVRVIQDETLVQWNSGREDDDDDNNNNNNNNNNDSKNSETSKAAGSPELGAALQRLLRHPVEIRRLAAVTLWSLEQTTGHLAVDSSLLLSATAEPDSLSVANPLASSSSSPHRRLASGAFLGVHMDMVADNAVAGWHDYNAQAPFYLAEAKKRGLATIYLATSSVPIRDEFRIDAGLKGIRVFTKEDLLEDSSRTDMARLESLTEDQQKLVDFEVLMHSSYFYGFAQSRFSWSLAMARGTLPGAGPSFQKEDSVDEYRDKHSAVLGRHPHMQQIGVWP